MKKIITLTLSLSLSLSLLKADSWTQKTDFGGGIRFYNCGFSIGNKGYLGLGSPSSDDFWEYDPAVNTWTQKANFGGVSRFGAVGFSIGNKGYIGTGNYIDFWEWDQATNIWTQKADYGGGIIGSAAGFSIGSKGYIGTGYHSGVMSNDFWEWDQLTNTWSQKANFAGAARWLAVGFSIGNKGYIGTGADGISAGSNLFNDLWEWDQSSNVWTQKSSFSVGRVEAMGFSIGNFGFIGIGSVVWGSQDTDDLWEYNSVTDTWTQAANFGGGQRELAQGFSVGCKGYFGTGIINDNNQHSDFWEYTPNSYVCATAINETTASGLQISLAPNPAKDFIVITLNGKENSEITITDVQGKKVFESTSAINNHQSKISLAGLSKGIYFVEINDGKQKAVKKLLKE